MTVFDLLKYSVDTEFKYEDISALPEDVYINWVTKCAARYPNDKKFKLVTESFSGNRINGNYFLSELCNHLQRRPVTQKIKLIKILKIELENFKGRS